MRTRIKTLGILCAGTLLLSLVHLTVSSQAATSVNASFAECSDGLDNDHDGYIDYPQDQGCDSLHDEVEGLGSRGVFLTVSDGKKTVEAGGNLTYSVVLTTDLPTPQLVDVRFLLPHQTNLVSVSDSGFVDGVYVVWPNVSVFPGQSRRLKVDIQVDPAARDDHLIVGEAVTNLGERSADTTRVSHKTIKVRKNVQISVTDGKSVALPNEILRYRIVVNNVDISAQTVDVRAQLPVHLQLHEVTGPHTKNHRNVVWDQVHLEAGEGREFYLTGSVDRDTPEYFALQFRVSAGKSNAVDTTTVGQQAAVENTVKLSVSDGLKNAGIGELLTYNIVLENPTNLLITNTDVNAALPNFTEFVTASEGGQWTGSNVRWDKLTVSPYGKRILPYTVRVRSDAPANGSIRASVKAAGQVAVDITDVGVAPAEVQDAYANRVQKAPAPRRVSTRGMLRKVADRSEVRPGDTVAYTVRLRNTTAQPLRNVTVEDKFDPTYISVLGAKDQSNRISWTVPEIEPGKEWNATYRVRVHDNAPHATYLQNVVSAHGDGLNQISLNDRLYTSQLGVVHQLPPTGAGMDAIILGLAALMIAGPAIYQSRRRVTA